MAVTTRSFAKINIGLRIGAARPDGFHELLTVYQTIAGHDLIRVSVSRGSGIEIHCADPRVPRDESNTCFRIVELAMKALRAKGRIVIEIEKRLPVQGGLGGASSNAVAAMLGLELALKKTLSLEEKFRISSEVGSDLPLFLIGGTVLGVGRGEQVYPLPDFPAMACVVLTPEVGVSTPKAFAEWDRIQGLRPTSKGRDEPLMGRSSTDNTQVQIEVSTSPNPGETLRRAQGRRWGIPGPDEVHAGLRPAGQPGAAVPIKAISDYASAAIADPKLTPANVSDRISKLGRGVSAWLSKPYSSAPSRSLGRGGRAGNPLLWLVRAGIENDFEQVVFPEYPELREGKRALARAGASYASLSGSGSTLYGLFESRAEAVRAAGRLRREGWAALATATVPRRQYWRRIFDC